MKTETGCDFSLATDQELSDRSNIFKQPVQYISRKTSIFRDLRHHLCCCQVAGSPLVLLLLWLYGLNSTPFCFNSALEVFRILDYVQNVTTCRNLQIN